MASRKTSVAACALLVACAAAASLPSNFKKCAQNDPDFDLCLQNVVQDALPKLRSGVPELGVFSLDPLEVTSLHIGQGGGPVSIGLKFDNIKMYGISDSILSNQRANLAMYNLQVDAFTPKLRLDADYEVEGKVLLLPINGKGKCSIQLSDLKSHIEQKGIELKKGDKIYMNETQFLYNMEPRSMKMNFENLFNGDKTLGDNMNKFLNENWQAIFVELKPSLQTALGEIFRNIANRFFLRIPYNEIFPAS